MSDAHHDMTELGRDLARTVRVEWNASRVRTAENGLHARRRRRARLRGGAVAIAALAIVGFAMWSRERRELTTSRVTPALARAATPSPQLPAVSDAPSATLRFDDGSTATAHGDDARMRLVRESSSEIVVELAAGGGQFEVTAKPSRRFIVLAGSTSIETISAKFAAAHVEQRVRIDVIDGSVLAVSEPARREIRAGDSAIVPALASPARVVKPTRTKQVAPPPSTTNVSSWRDLARDGAYDEAYAALARADAPPVRDVAEELLLAADVKRLSRHPDEAVAPLQQIVRDHASDPRAPLAAFTLGRVFLQLRRPADAAIAFATADRLAPTGPMAQDALARHVEALFLAGDTAAAREAANLYLARFPNGRKLRSVRAWGGLP